MKLVAVVKNVRLGVKDGMTITISGPLDNSILNFLADNMGGEVMVELGDVGLTAAPAELKLAQEQPAKQEELPVLVQGEIVALEEEEPEAIEAVPGVTNIVPIPEPAPAVIPKRRGRPPRQKAIAAEPTQVPSPNVPKTFEFDGHTFNAIVPGRTEEERTKLLKKWNLDGFDQDDPEARAVWKVVSEDLRAIEAQWRREEEEARAESMAKVKLELEEEERQAAKAREVEATKKAKKMLEEEGLLDDDDDDDDDELFPEDTETKIKVKKELDDDTDELNFEKGNDFGFTEEDQDFGTTDEDEN